MRRDGKSYQWTGCRYGTEEKYDSGMYGTPIVSGIFNDQLVPRAPFGGVTMQSEKAWA